MGICIEKLPHSCGSLNGLQVFQHEDGSYDGYCFACKKIVENPYGDNVPPPNRQPKQITQEELDEIYTYPIPDLTQLRGLRLDSLAYFGIRCGVSTADGHTPELVYFPYTENGQLTSWKIRLLTEKKMWSIGKMKTVDLCGWEQAKRSGSKRLYITEGEFDMVALFQILKDSVANTKWATMVPAVCSLPNGASSVAKVITRMAHQLRQTFQEIVFVPDQDKPGKEAADTFSRLYPGVYIAELPCKDANDCIVNGKESECINAVKWKPNQPKNTRIILGGSLRDVAKKKPEMGMPWPWQGLTRATRGRRRGEIIYFGAGVKLNLAPVKLCEFRGTLS